ncbi:hypothetical protein WKI71_40965 [Streptomyces sp. MS1.AVA.1]|uniref:Lipoprotein n=1 Tax=Streptomyces machairae TaxID=3134109 RepID=A0ABU8UU59_9ACTN
MTHSISGLFARSRRAGAATAAACLAVSATLAGCGGTDEEPAHPSSDRAQATQRATPSADRSSPAPSPRRRAPRTPSRNWRSAPASPSTTRTPDPASSTSSSREPRSSTRTPPSPANGEHRADWWTSLPTPRPT